MVIGEIIRQIRKDKQITLKDLAKGICSLGKMSNIENGKAFPSHNELESIAAKLKVPIDKLKTHSFTSRAEFEVKFGGWIGEAEEIEDLLRLGFYAQGNQRLKAFTNKTMGLEELSLLTDFLWAWYYKVMREDVNCMKILKRIINKSALSYRDSLVQLRSKHMLCALYLKLNDVEKADVVLKEVREEVLKNNRFGSEYWKVRYNTSILLTVQGDYDLARLHAESLSKDKNVEYQATYMLGILDFLNNDISSAADRIYLAKKKFRDYEHNNLLLKVRILEYFVQKKFVSSSTAVLNKDDIIGLLNLALAVKGDYYNISVYLLNVLLFISLERDYDNEVLEIQQGLKKLLESNIDDNLKVQSYLYLARAAKKLGKDDEESLNYIDLGLSSIINKGSALYGMLIYEKIKLQRKKVDPLFKEALDSFVKANDYRVAMKFNFIYVLPAIVI